ncbi:hypothetical protein CS0771_64390 [Catellatospora sp. IY07-71]|uniref:hypothetical protein n=1 Tax=Catellatospora sp. IY07-71 TaxID=2728827 RepID=UPI001BB40983|nr:hypothetical protein [Catellatospora sp. IY07-71]BCJ76895.1 hypothetical protein CS0771_64390 [Catellatospora sp. IY07-71]
MGQPLFSFGDLLIVGLSALALGALAATLLLSSTVREMRAARRFAVRQRGEAMTLLQLAEQTPGITTGSWDPERLRRVEQAPRRAAGRAGARRDPRHQRSV